MMLSKKLAFITFLGLAGSETTSVVSLFIYGADQQSLDGSVVQTVGNKHPPICDCNLIAVFQRNPIKQHIASIAQPEPTPQIAE